MEHLGSDCCPDKKRPQRASLNLSLCEDTVRRQLTMIQETGPHQATNLPKTWSWTSQSPEL